MRRDFLKTIKKEKLAEIEELKVKYPPSQVKHMLLQRRKFYNFKHALRHGSRISVIAEVKYASPSRGAIADAHKRDPVDVALEYQGGGADAISVLTDHRHFKGSFEYLRRIRDFVEVPLLCKDFFVDAYQVRLARAMGADAVLLIVAMLEDEEVIRIVETASDLHCDVLFEVHDQRDLDRAMAFDAEIIGVNSRDLHTLTVDINTFSRLIPQIPEEKIRVAESGISAEVLPLLKQLKVDAVLVGEYFMRQGNIYYSLKRFMEQAML